MLYNLRSGHCERPHCLYKHAKDERDMFGALYKSPVADFSGVQHYCPSAGSGAPVNAGHKDDCLLELERINKAIETVKNEVEQEQRRLSHYQTAQEDSGSAGTVAKFSVSQSKTIAKDVNENSYRPSSHTRSTKPYSPATKYVVDNSKPRTDLEYDPLSNFSSDLRSYRDQTAKIRQGVKRTRDAVCSDRRRSGTRRSQSQLPDNTDEEGDLVIDIPISPDKKRSRAQKPASETTSVKPEDVVEEVEEVKAVSVAPDLSPHLPSKPQEDNVQSPPVVLPIEVSKVDDKCSAENTEDLSNISVIQERKSEQCDVNIFDDLSRCLQDLTRERQKKACSSDTESVAESNSDVPIELEETSCETNESLRDGHQKDQAVEENVSSLIAESPHCEPPCSVEKMNPTEPNAVPQEATFPHNDPVTNAFSSCQQHTSQAQKIQQPAPCTVQSYCPPVQSALSVPSYDQTVTSQMPGKMQEVAFAANYASHANYLEQAAATSGISPCQSLHVSSTPVQPHLTNEVDLLSAPTGQISVTAHHREVIAGESSSEEEELIFSDADLSDSDPMEECYRIFMEANKEETGATKQSNAHVRNVDVETPEVSLKPKSLPGQRKRVAHKAKHNEQPVAKSRQPQVLVPLRGASGPSSAPQLSVPSKVQQVQQRASMLTPPVKGGQAFVSSTTQRKAVTTAPPPIQNTANQQVPMQNACVNYLPAGTTVIQVGNDLHFILPEGSYSLPIASITTPVTSVLTPITPTHTSPFSPTHTYHQATDTPVHSYHTTAVTPMQTLRTHTTAVAPMQTLRTHVTAVTPMQTLRTHTTAVAPMQTLRTHTTAVTPMQTLRTHTTAVAPMQTLRTHTTAVAPMQTLRTHMTAVTPMQTLRTHMTAVTPMQTLRTHTTAVTPAHTYYPTPAAPNHTPVHTSSSTPVSASTHANPATSSTSQAAVQVPAKPMPTKRKAKQHPKVKDKVPHDVRQRYVNMFVEEFLKTSATVEDAFEKALAEERSVYDRSVNKLKYLSVAVNALKRLKNQSVVAAKDEKETSGQMSKGNIPLNIKTLKGNDDAALYESLNDYVLTEEKLTENNYPLQHPEKPGSAALFADNKKGTTDPLKRICCRCGATYSVSQTGKHTRKEECTYHYGKGVENKVPGGVETRYSCCEGVVGAPGCQVFKLHVHDAVSLDGFVSTLPRPDSDESCPGVYSVDCEMCYTTHGLELCRVTVVSSGLQVIYDTFVRPDHEVIDYNTRFSGICEEDVKGTSTSIREVQRALLSFISSDTILIGHSLETDLCALKLLHGTVVDTSVVFPHRLGPPHKLTINNLTTDYLRRIIQESVCGHDTAEEAAACLELMLWKVKEDGKGKRW